MGTNRVFKLDRLENILLKAVNENYLDHNVYTPVHLCCEIFNQLSDLSAKRVLVLYSCEMASLLVNKYGCNPNNVYLLGHGENQYRKYLANLFGINYCEMDWFTSKAEYKNMKFDVIVGNPPYDLTNSKKIWPDFVKKSFELTSKDGIVALVTPSTWLNSNGSVYKNIRTTLTSKYDLKVVNRDADNYFKDVGIDICYWIAMYNPYAGITQYIENSNKQIIDLRNGQPKSSEIQIADSLVQKIVTKGPGIKWILNDKGKRKVASKELTPKPTSTHTFRTYQSTKNIGYLNRDIGDFGKLKLAVNYSSAFYNAKAADFNMPITSDNIGSLMGYVFINSEDEGKQLRSYLCSKVIRWLVANYKKQNTGFSDAVKRCAIPQVPFKTWTDGDVYAHFNLTQEEIDYIEQNI